MKVDLLIRRETKFVLWRPKNTTTPPKLVIGQFQAGNPPTLVNEQTFNLTVSQPRAAAARFSVSPATLTIAANGTATFTVTVAAGNVTLNGSFNDFERDVVVTGATGPSMQLPLWARFK